MGGGRLRPTITAMTFRNARSANDCNHRDCTLAVVYRCLLSGKPDIGADMAVGPSLPSRPGEFSPRALTGRVEDWRAGLGPCSCSLLTRPFVCECHNISTVPRFQPPPRRTQHAVFPHYALLFASPQGLWDLSCWGDFRHGPPNLVAVEQPQRFVQPLRTPPLPAEALSIPGPRHVAPDLLFHPVFNEAEALAGISHRKVRSEERRVG